MAKGSACSHGRLGTAQHGALGSASRSGEERGELRMLGKGYGAWRYSCAPGRCSGLWLPEPGGGFRGWYHPVRALVLALLPEHLPPASPGPAAPWPDQHGRARVVQLTGQGSLQRALRQSPGGQLTTASVRTSFPGFCRAADVSRGWSAGVCSHPHCWEQLAGGSWAWALAPASPSNVFWQSSTLPAWREGGTVRGKEG